MSKDEKPTVKRVTLGGVVAVLMGSCFALEAIDQVVLRNLANSHERSRYFVEEAISQSFELDQVNPRLEKNYAKITGVYAWRYQYGYNYLIKDEGPHYSVTVSGESPHRRSPLWIFSIGLREYSPTFATNPIRRKYNIYKS